MKPIEIIGSGAEQLIGIEDLKERLQEGKTLRVKLGVDPTRPDLTFGHMVVFNKLRQFQELGHQAVLIIGDYTATIGDPSGRSVMRPPLSEEAVKANATTYLEQAFKVLDREKTEVRYNSEWFKGMSFHDALDLSRKMTVARMLERDDFSKRFEANAPISIVEFLYPLVQGYDSIRVESDVELGGTDQLFNLLVGRALQKEAGQAEQGVICMPLLVGLDGVKKMSKSFDNFIAFNDPPKEMFGKIMSISDSAMWEYYKLLLCKPEDFIAKLKGEHPMEVKKRLAVTMVSMFYSEEEALHEREQFEGVFSKGNLPEDMPVFSWSDLSDAEEGSLVDLIAKAKIVSSKKEIRRLIEQGGIKVNEDKADEPFQRLKRGDHVIQVGKRHFFKILG